MTITAFQTPQKERSFSGLIDQVVRETGRASKLVDIISYVNMTFRECQALGLFARDLRESEITATADPHIYTPARYFRSVRGVKYATQCQWPTLKLPGKAQRDQPWYFYRAEDYFVFKGVIVGETIKLAEYYWSNPFLYYRRLEDATTYLASYDVRPAYFDLEDLQWLYLDGGGTAYVTDLGDDDEEERRRNLSEHWLMEAWYEAMVEGTKAKTFKGVDDARAATSYSLYKQMQTSLRLTSGFEAEVSAIV